MRIVDAREITVPIGSSMRNAAIDFSGMTVSIAALVTDETRHGKPVIGYGFNSNGRYAARRDPPRAAVPTDPGRSPGFALRP